MLAVADRAKRFEIIEMMRAADRAVLAAARFAVIDFQPDLLATRAPEPHGLLKGQLSRQRAAIGAFGRRLSTQLATILIANLCRSTRERPPMIFPKRRSAFLAAPLAPAPGEQFAAPGAAAQHGFRERTSSKK
jgi:hypothetical protein